MRKSVARGVGGVQEGGVIEPLRRAGILPDVQSRARQLKKKGEKKEEAKRAKRRLLV